MTLQLAVTLVLALAGAAAMLAAVASERRMHRHRRAGVSYAHATLRADGGWRRAELFTEEGLAHQRRASRRGVAGAVLWLLALAAWVALGAVGMER